MEMKFVHMYNCFSCNVEECIHASVMERAIERMNGVRKRRSGRLAGNCWGCLGRSTTRGGMMVMN